MSAPAVFGLLFLAVSIVACSIGFIAPFWLENVNWGEQWGLWGICEGDDDCVWFFEDDFAWENTLPTWHKVCQVCFALAMLLLLFTFFFACIHLCCACQKNIGLNLAISGLLICASACILVCVAIFGGTVHDKLGADLYGNYIYRWGYFVSIGGLIGVSISAILYLVAGFKKDPYQGYTKNPGGPYYVSN